MAIDIVKSILQVKNKGLEKKTIILKIGQKKRISEND